jgi:hypothetical protein
MPSPRQLDLIIQITLLSGTLLFGYWALKKVLSDLDGNISSKKKKEWATKLNRPEIVHMDISAHEAKFLQEVISSKDIDVSFNDIGGMDHKIEEVKDNIILPMEIWKVLKGKSSVTPCPTGVLLCNIYRYDFETLLLVHRWKARYWKDINRQGDR